MYNAYILKQRPIGASSGLHLFPAAQWVQTGPHTAPQNVKFPANVNSLDIYASILHSDELWGALDLVNA
jgi:hypothetical protein